MMDASHISYNRYGKSHCTSHSIFYDQLYDAVLQDIQDCAALALADEDAAVAALCEKFSESGTDFMVRALARFILPLTYRKAERT